LLVPHGRTSSPAVLFLSGSGAQDRNETLLGHEPFLVMADHLARRGVASLRCDDRGVGASGGNVFMATMDELAGDVHAAMQVLAERPEIDDSAIGLVGHSEGALLAPLVASRQNAVDFLVLLAPPGVPMDQLLLQQARDRLTSRGISQVLIDRVLAMQSRELELVKDRSLSRDELVTKLHARSAELRKHFTEAELELLELTRDTTKQAIQQASTPWFRSLMRQMPADYLWRLDVPVLALFGAKDVQVSPHENAAAVVRALEAGPIREYTVTVLDGLNHLFQHATTGAVSEYGAIEETIAPDVLKLVADWVQRQSGRTD
jgi:pimeloyl-ACP methyl ester carboxylesterase